jgi:hypothetical protein
MKKLLPFLLLNLFFYQISALAKGAMPTNKDNVTRYLENFNADSQEFYLKSNNYETQYFCF